MNTVLVLENTIITLTGLHDQLTREASHVIAGTRVASQAKIDCFAINTAQHDAL